ncbi:MAG: DUF4437 domain-containing protein [Pseudomonadota bacterium]
MSRPHIEFIQAQVLPWEPNSWREGTQAKILSHDQETGALSSLVAYPSLWQADQIKTTVDEEIYVLDGELKINGDSFKSGCYGFLPAGFCRSISTEAGAVVLSFLELSSSDSPDEYPHMLRLDTHDMPWSDATDPNVIQARVGLKELRVDPRTSERTWILKMDVEDGERFAINGIERHPVVEELFILEGDITMATGRLRQGAYFWRPPMIPHGPTAVEGRFVGFFRCRGGAFETFWSDFDTQVIWDHKYKPILPKAIREKAFDADEQTRKY